MLVAQAEFALRADHARGLDAADDGRGERHGLARLIADKSCADLREGDLLAGAYVRRAADDRPRLAAKIDDGETESVRVRMRADVEDPANEDAAPVAPRPGLVGGLQSGHREPMGQRSGVHPQRDVLSQP